MDFAAVKGALQRTVGINTLNYREFDGSTGEMAKPYVRGGAVYIERFRVSRHRSDRKFPLAQPPFKPKTASFRCGQNSICSQSVICSNDIQSGRGRA